MNKIQEMYESSVRPMVPAERLQLARLILDDLAPSNPATDISDEWTDDDVSDVTAYAAQSAGRSNSDSKVANEPR